MKIKLAVLSLLLVSVASLKAATDPYFPAIINGTGQSVEVEATRGGFLESKHKYTLAPGQALHNLGDAGPQKFHAKTQGWDKEVTRTVVITPVGTMEISTQEVAK